MNRNTRQCPICTGPLADSPKWLIFGHVRNGKRIPPNDDFTKKGWCRWICQRCGTVVWVLPFQDKLSTMGVRF
jgi:hypothetical protein